MVVLFINNIVIFLILTFIYYFKIDFELNDMKLVIFYFGFRFINGIIKFDRKVLLLSTSLRAVQMKSLNKWFWICLFVGFLIFYVGIQLNLATGTDTMEIHINNAIGFMFRPPDIIIFVVMITSCFYLYCLGYRFCALSRLWKCLPSEMIAMQSTRWSNYEIAAVAEYIRLLHADLCDLLILFSLGYGPVLLFYFLFTFAHALIDMFLLIVGSNKRISILPCIFYLQYIISICIILCLASWTIDKV